MRIAYNNLVNAATAPTALTASPVYPIANIQNQRLAKPWRSTSITAQTIVVDLGSAQTISVAAVLGHNLTSGATITLEGNPSDSWGSASVSTTITTIVGGMCLNYFTGGSHQYWRFSIDNATGGTSYIEIGNLWLGTYHTFSPASLYDFRVIKHRSDTVTHGRGRQKYSTEGVGWRSFHLNFPRTAGSSLSAIQTMYDTVGNHTSVIFSNFNVRRDYPIVEPVYCSLNGDISFQHVRNMGFSYSLDLEEEL